MRIDFEKNSGDSNFTCIGYMKPNLKLSKVANLTHSDKFIKLETLRKIAGVPDPLHITNDADYRKIYCNLKAYANKAKSFVYAVSKKDKAIYPSLIIVNSEDTSIIEKFYIFDFSRKSFTDFWIKNDLEFYLGKKDAQKKI